jgi:hypothetical protein
MMSVRQGVPPPSRVSHDPTSSFVQCVINKINNSRAGFGFDNAAGIVGCARSSESLMFECVEIIIVLIVCISKFDDFCFDDDAYKRACSHQVNYCSPECQKADWKNHKVQCKASRS